jgi:Trk-type K+ transport system membrane component
MAKTIATFPYHKQSPWVAWSLFAFMLAGTIGFVFSALHMSDIKTRSGAPVHPAVVYTLGFFMVCGLVYACLLIFSLFNDERKIRFTEKAMHLPRFAWSQTDLVIPYDSIKKLTLAHMKFKALWISTTMMRSWQKQGLAENLFANKQDFEACCLLLSQQSGRPIG